MNPIVLELSVEKSIDVSVSKSTDVMPITIGMTIPVPRGDGFATFIYDQMSPSDEWVIDHDLNCFPSVTVVDSANNVVIGNVLYVTDKQLIVTFVGAFSGKAFIN